MFVTGRVPIRRAGDGAAPVPGDGSHDWIGWASGDQLPHYVAPASGRLVNANERIAPPDFPVFMGRDWFGDWRARRIREMLEATDRHTRRRFRPHADRRASAPSPSASCPPCARCPAQPGAAGQAQALLRGWDGAMTMDAPQPLIFNAWIDEFYSPPCCATHDIPLGDGGPMPDFVACVLSPAGAHWCGGDCNAAARRGAERRGRRRWRERFGPDPAAWRWGTAHPAVFANPLLRAIPVLGKLTTIKHSQPGRRHHGRSRRAAVQRFQSVHGASYRGVYDLADLDRTLFW